MKTKKTAPFRIFFILLMLFLLLVYILNRIYSTPSQACISVAIGPHSTAERPLSTLHTGQIVRVRLLSGDADIQLRLASGKMYPLVRLPGNQWFSWILYTGNYYLQMSGSTFITDIMVCP